jgi:rhombotail lipoprotein
MSKPSLHLRIISTLILVCSVTLLGACAIFSNQSRTQATSVMQYLYPNQSQHLDSPAVPVLNLPLRVGIAFVPSARANGYNYSPAAFSENAKTALLQRVAAEFKALPYVGSIQIIPSTYLRPDGSFANLDQVKNMFGVDVIALVAYDQTQFTNEGVLSFAYWTIVGAYVVQGEKNDTETLMEAVVYDIRSRKLLFRAPGASVVKASATPVNLSEQLRVDSLKGFDNATTELIANLKTELDNFKTRVKDSPQDFQIVRQPGYTGAGALDGGFALTIAGLALTRLRRRD